MEPSQTPNRSRKPSEEKRSNPFLQYSGMAFEMLATIGIFAAGGYFLDKKMNLEFPIATILLTLLGLAVAFYRIYKQ